jgi:hypothetical protein
LACAPPALAAQLQPDGRSYTTGHVLLILQQGLLMLGRAEMKMKICIGIMTCFFSAHTFASGTTVLAVKTGDRAWQERVLRRAIAIAMDGPVEVHACGTGMTMLFNRNIETNVLLKQAEASGVKIRTCRKPMTSDMILIQVD